MHVLDKPTLREQLVTERHKRKALEHDLNELKSLVVKCFVNAPMQYDDVIVLSHNYHKVCDFLNKG